MSARSSRVWVSVFVCFWGYWTAGRWSTKRIQIKWYFDGGAMMMTMMVLLVAVWQWLVMVSFVWGFTLKLASKSSFPSALMVWLWLLLAHPPPPPPLMMISIVMACYLHFLRLYVTMPPMLLTTLPHVACPIGSIRTNLGNCHYSCCWMMGHWCHRCHYFDLQWQMCLWNMDCVSDALFLVNQAVMQVAIWIHDVGINVKYVTFDRKWANRYFLSDRCRCYWMLRVVVAQRTLLQNL